MRKVLVTAAAVAVLLVPASAGAADKTATLPDQQLWPTSHSALRQVRLILEEATRPPA